MKRLLLTLIIPLCLLATSKAGDTWFVDKNYVYQKGSQLSHDYLKKHSPEFQPKLKKIMPWVVRIEVQHNFEGGSLLANHGTGIILEGGIVMTAKHVLTNNLKDPKSKIRIYLTTIEGQVFEATVITKGKKDWAALQMKVDPAFSKLLKSPIKVAHPVKGESCVFLGYPGRLGLDSKGKVQSFNKGDAKAGIAVSKLLPMMIVGKAQDLKAMNLSPLAGFPPVGGMSGGPIFNLKGELVAVQHSVSTTTEDATGKIIRYGIGATATTDISTLFHAKEKKVKSK